MPNWLIGLLLFSAVLFILGLFIWKYIPEFYKPDKEKGIVILASQGEPGASNWIITFIDLSMMIKNEKDYDELDATLLTRVICQIFWHFGSSSWIIRKRIILNDGSMSVILKDLSEDYPIIGEHATDLLKCERYQHILDAALVFNNKHKTRK